MKEKHWYKMYPDKWMGSRELRSCSIEARGLLVELMNISFPEGRFEIDGAEGIKEICSYIGIRKSKFLKVLCELLDKKRIVSVTKLPKSGDRVSFPCNKSVNFYEIPRMIKEHENTVIASEHGKKGGSPKLKTLKGTLNPTLKNPLKLEQEQEEEIEVDFLKTFEDIAGGLPSDMSRMSEIKLDDCKTIQRNLINDGLTPCSPDTLLKKALIISASKLIEKKPIVIERAPSMEFLKTSPFSIKGKKKNG